MTDLELKRTLETRLRFGNYPEIFTQTNLAEKERLLNALKSDYLLQDILKFENVKGSDILYKLLQLLALQVGSEVSFSELAKTLEINKGTVKKYIDILEKGFIIFKLSAFSRNLRVEISKKNKIYFYDVGLRNALISNHNPIDLRLDKGFIWENYMISERIKFNSYTRNYANLYFWRTYNQKELDLVEEREGQLFGYEFKLTKDKMGSSKTFLKSYPNSNLSLVNRDNFLDFVT